MTARVTAVILAGGRATRMGGRAKHALVIDGETIFARQCAVLAPWVSEIIVSLAPDAPEIAGYRSVRDASGPDGRARGPLAGVLAALDAITTPWLLVVAGDMPDIRAGVIDLLLATAVRTSPSEIDAVGVQLDGRPEPLFALLRPSCRTAVARMLAAGRYKASQLFTDEGLRIAWVADDALRAADPELRSFRNVNAPSDLRGGKPGTDPV